MPRLLGIDVSHYQSPSAPAGVPYPEIAKSCSFVMVRATYGIWKDPSAIAHVLRARDAGLQVGLYHFFRTTQPITDQLASFCAAAHDVGLRAGDIAPALDIEDDPKVATIGPAWQEPVRAMIGGLLASFGECLAYITQRDFGRLGKPEWLLERPLWVAHYTSAPAPATPGNKPWRLWQYRVGPYLPGGPGGAYSPMLLDHNVAVTAPPVCTRVPPRYPSGVVSAPDAAPGFTDEELRALRDESASWLAGLEPDLDGHGAANLNEPSDTDPAPPPSQGEPST